MFFKAMQIAGKLMSPFFCLGRTTHMWVALRGAFRMMPLKVTSYSTLHEYQRLNYYSCVPVTTILRTGCYQNILYQCYRKPSPTSCSQEAGLYLQQTSRSCHKLLIIFMAFSSGPVYFPELNNWKRADVIVWQIDSRSQHSHTEVLTTHQIFF